MNWYRVIKTIKHRRYVYLQRTWREGKHVRTENRYIGPELAAVEATGSNQQTRVAYHGSPISFTGRPEPSTQGTFGPGFYLTSSTRAKFYSRYDAGMAAKLLQYLGAGEQIEIPPPQHEGTVTAYDLSDLNLLTLFKSSYYDVLDELLGKDAQDQPDYRERLQAVLQDRGYDGLDVRDEQRDEITVFPASLHKLRSVTTTE